MSVYVLLVLKIEETNSVSRKKLVEWKLNVLRILPSPDPSIEILLGFFIKIMPRLCSSTSGLKHILMPSIPFKFISKFAALLNGIINFALNLHATFQVDYKVCPVIFPAGDPFRIRMQAL